ncbi:uncharacterized protein [Diabrotica undecimpunctata]|uniref:uncharacterized protein n=1 Tax=Diabrotica undecimpunctata TaxID=50387 RepID=UPI003B63CC1F
MAAEHSRACKWKIDFSEFDSDHSDQDPFLNESEDDKDYTVSGNSSDSENINLKMENEEVFTPQTSRGVLPTPEKKAPSRWRQKNTQRHKKIKRKTKRNLGHEYINTKGKKIEPKKLGAPCGCTKQCRQLLAGKENDIFNAFWNLGNYDKQNIYLFSTMTVIPKKRSYPKKTKGIHSSRNVSVKYRVEVNGDEIEICKKEFLAIHGISKKRIERLVHQNKEGASTPKSDERGKHDNNNKKIPEEHCEYVRQHINLIPKYTSHYSRQKNPTKVYLDSDISISSLHHDYYLEWCRQNNFVAVTQDKYRRIFCSEFNIGFKLPKSDTCKVCDSMNVKISNEADIEIAKTLKIDLELHQRRAQAMQDLMKNDTEEAKATGNAMVISFDLQQAMPVPNLTVGAAFYLRKAWVYNLGIHDCISGKAFMYMWPENIAKRGSDEIASILYKHFRTNRPTANKLIVYTDNCSGQNKNWSLICLWQQLTIEGIFTSIEHKYLVVGHTRLPCDRDFAVIEKYKRHRLKQVYTPDDWYEAVRKCKRKNCFEVIVLKQSDFFSFKELHSEITKKRHTDDKEKVNFSKISSLKFSSEQPNIMYIKHLINEDYKAVNIGKKGMRKSILLSRDLKSKYTEPIPLNRKKIENISQLLQFIPPAFLKFYEEIGACQQILPGTDNESLEYIEHFDDFSDIENIDN